MPPDRAEKIRAFVALKPPARWIDELRAMQETLRAELNSREIRWVRPEQIHITLRFFGSVPAEQVSAIIDAMSKACAGIASFILRGRGLGCFPSVSRPRVLWAGVEDGANATAQLQNAIQIDTREFGEPPEDRPFSPHLTLARIKEADRETRTHLGRVVEREWLTSSEWQVSEVLLMQSHLSPQGAQYEILHSVPLVGAVP